MARHHQFIRHRIGRNRVFLPARRASDVPISFRLLERPGFTTLRQIWSSLESGLSGGRHLGEIHIDYLNKPRLTDYASRNIYTLSATAYDDNGATTSRNHQPARFNGGNRSQISALQVFFEAGTGLATGQGSAPQAMLAVSKDGGFTYGNERWVSIGAIGSYLTRAVWRRLGQARDWVFKIRVTDSVKVVITGASLDLDVEK